MAFPMLTKYQRWSKRISNTSKPSIQIHFRRMHYGRGHKQSCVSFMRLSFLWLLGTVFNHTDNQGRAMDTYTFLVFLQAVWHHHVRGSRLFFFVATFIVWGVNRREAAFLGRCFIMYAVRGHTFVQDKQNFHLTTFSTLRCHFRRRFLILWGQKISLFETIILWDTFAPGTSNGVWIHYISTILPSYFTSSEVSLIPMNWG